MRLFVAIQVPEEVKRALGRAQRSLSSLMARSQVRWTPLEQVHLTLRFLGNVDESRLEELATALRTQVPAPQTPLRLLARGLGAFPSLHRPRVVWAGLEEGEESAGQLSRLQTQVQESTQPFTREVPEARFHAHVTLGRINEISSANRQILSTHFEQEQTTCYGEWVANGFDLVQSQLSSSGAKHTVFTTFSFPPA